MSTADEFFQQDNYVDEEVESNIDFDRELE